MRPLLTLFTFAFLGAACGSRDDVASSTSEALTANDVVSLATANVGKMACSTNSLGGKYFDSSCTGNGGQPEYWCADFARWVWANAGASNTSELTAAAGSFYVYGQNHGTLSNTPSLGAAVVFNYQGNGYADHVAIVTQLNTNGTIETVSGDWNGDSGTEAQFASTSKTVLNSPAYAGTVGTSPAIMGMQISGFIKPVGLDVPYAATYVGQSFPLATTALTMTAGETVPSYIELKNSGSKAWDSNTRLATTQPRDRTSVFADSSWVAPNRLAAVSGTVAPGATYKFQFNLHAPEKTGTYEEYFGVVEDGVAWFSDPGEGGPADDDLEVQIKVIAAPDAGVTDASAPSEDGGVTKEPNAPDGDTSAPSTASNQGGCSMTPASRANPFAVVPLALLALRRKKSKTI